jgi:hypothetical protein
MRLGGRRRFATLQNALARELCNLSKAATIASTSAQVL